MADQPDVAEEQTPERIQDFVFQRELAEVYLLLDYLSGRSDRSLTHAIADADGSGKISIEEICRISWPPEGSKPEQAAQAATLLLAKDALNSAAKPATGTSIAFTLLVAGDDESAEAWRQQGHGFANWLRRAFSFRKRQAAAPPRAPAGPNPPAGGGGSPPPPGGSRGAFPSGSNAVPSRASLARVAYPGLIGSARRSYWTFNLIIGFLFAWLIMTCALSWNIAAGRAIVARLDAIEKDRAVIDGKIEKAESAPAGGSQAAGTATDPNAAPSQNGATQSAAVQAANSTPVNRYCTRPLRLGPAKTPDGREIKQFESVTQRQLCDQVDENRVLYISSCLHIHSWLTPWRSLGLESPAERERACAPLPTDTKSAEIRAIPLSEHQRASVLVEILATAVLPIFYGFLGAGAAVVRDIWSKMRDFLLLPRDLTLSLGRLALGAVIGACIGLFISPSTGSAPSGATLTTAVALTPSALSFIAGFGVEGVFVALESLIKRVFNIPDPKT